MLKRFASVILLLTCVGEPAHAATTTVDFDYAGIDQTGGSAIISGTGSFSYIGIGVVDLTGLSSFSFVQSVSGAPLGSSTFSYSLTDLTSFSFLSATSLSLTTVAVAGTNEKFFSESFEVLGTLGQTFNSQSPPVLLSQGPVTIFAAAVPEPSTWAMMLLGFAGLSFAFRQSRSHLSFS